MSEKINDGGPAFPHSVRSFELSQSKTSSFDGMSLRDWFAGMALPAIIQGNTELAKLGVKSSSGTIASDAYKAADAMLAQRDKKP